MYVAIANSAGVHHLLRPSVYKLPVLQRCPGDMVQLSLAWQDRFFHVWIKAVLHETRL